MHQPRVTEFYERHVLPELFERLDRAFPEFQWTRTAQGWTGSKPDASTFGRGVTCSQPWGFVDSRGLVTSWLVYVNGGTRPHGRAFIDAVARLANRAGLDDSVLRDCTLEQHTDAERNERQREILEAFSACCNAALAGERGRDLRTALEHDHGVNTRDLATLPLGLFTSQQEIAEHLVALGFTRDEVSESWLVGDNRIAGRLVIPWRDRFGNIRTIVAKDILNRSRFESRDLYLRGRHQAEGFGLDVALRPRSGGRTNLLVADSLLDVIAFHSHGVTNAIAFGNRGTIVALEQWERLVEFGVQSVTLIGADGEGDSTRTFTSIRNAHRSPRSPHVYVLAASELGQAGSLRAVRPGDTQAAWLERRVHGYRFVANSILRRHKTQRDWNDTAWMNCVQDAIRFDTELADRERMSDLDRHFWPPLMEALSLTWDGLRGVLGRATPQPVVAPVPPPQLTVRYGRRWTLHNLHELVAELRRTLHADDIAGFRALLVAAVRDLEWDVEPVVVHEPRNEDLSRLRMPTPRPAPVNYTNNPWSDGEEVAELPIPLPKSNPRPQPSPGDIRRLAYMLWEKRGQPTGMDQQFWFEAEEALKTAAKFELERSRPPRSRAA